jgi:hypothetical protein
MISSEKMQRIHSRPGRPTGGFEEGAHLSKADEKILTESWAELAVENGVDQLPDQPSEKEIKNFRP